MPFRSDLTLDRDVAFITLAGELDASVVQNLREAIEEASARHPRRLVFVMRELDFMASAGLRMLVFARQKMDPNVDIYIVGAHSPVTETIEYTGFQHSVTMVDDYADAYDESAVG